MTLSPEITAAIDSLIDATLRVALEDVPELEARLAKAEYAARTKLESLITGALTYPDFLAWLCDNLQDKTDEALRKDTAVILVADKFDREKEDVIAEMRAKIAANNSGG